VIDMRPLEIGIDGGQDPFDIGFIRNDELVLTPAMRGESAR